jgi:hypothetical protein
MLPDSLSESHLVLKAGETVAYMKFRKLLIIPSRLADSSNATVDASF